MRRTSKRGSDVDRRPMVDDLRAGLHEVSRTIMDELRHQAAAADSGPERP